MIVFASSRPARTTNPQDRNGRRATTGRMRRSAATRTGGERRGGRGAARRLDGQPVRVVPGRGAAGGRERAGSGASCEPEEAPPGAIYLPVGLGHTTPCVSLTAPIPL